MCKNMKIKFGIVFISLLILSISSFASGPPYIRFLMPGYAPNELVTDHSPYIWGHGQDALPVISNWSGGSCPANKYALFNPSGNPCDSSTITITVPDFTGYGYQLTWTLDPGPLGVCECASGLNTISAFNIKQIPVAGSVSSGTVSVIYPYNAASGAAIKWTAPVPNGLNSCAFNDPDKLNEPVAYLVCSANP